MVWQAIAGIAGAAASILGSGDTTSTTTPKVHLKSLVKKSIKAGFNPLTILNAGGLSAFTSTTTTNSAPGGIAGGIAQGVGQFAQGMSNLQNWRVSQQQQALQAEMVQAQINNLRGVGSGALPGSGYGNGSPGLNNGGYIPGTNHGEPGQWPGFYQETFDKPVPPGFEKTPFAFQDPLSINTGGLLEMKPGSTGVEPYETMFGDLGGQVIGTPIVVLETIGHNSNRLGKHLREKWSVADKQERFANQYEAYQRAVEQHLAIKTYTPPNTLRRWGNPITENQGYIRW